MILQVKNDIVVRKYKTQLQASKETGISQSNMSYCISKTRKTAGGFQWFTTEGFKRHLRVRDRTLKRDIQKNMKCYEEEQKYLQKILNRENYLEKQEIRNFIRKYKIRQRMIAKEINVSQQTVNLCLNSKVPSKRIVNAIHHFIDQYIRNNLL